MNAQAQSTPGTEVTQKTIVAVVGLPFSGKTEVRNQADLLGYQTIDVSRQDDLKRKLIGTLQHDKILVVEGIWMWEQLADLKEQFNANVPIVHVESEFDERLSRANDGHVGVTAGMLEQADEQSMSRGLESVVRKSQINIHNGKHTSLEQLYDRTKAVLDLLE